MLQTDREDVLSHRCHSRELHRAVSVHGGTVRHGAAEGTSTHSVIVTCSQHGHLKLSIIPSESPQLCEWGGGISADPLIQPSLLGGACWAGEIWAKQSDGDADAQRQRWELFPLARFWMFTNLSERVQDYCNSSVLVWSFRLDVPSEQWVMSGLWTRLLSAATTLYLTWRQSYSAVSSRVTHREEDVERPSRQTGRQTGRQKWGEIGVWSLWALCESPL